MCCSRSLASFGNALLVFSIVAGFGALALALEKDAGWTVLFDGHSTDAFRGYKQAAFPTGHWKVEADALTTVPGGHYGAWDLLTKEEFTDFDLRFDWRMTEGGNSGVLYCVQENAQYAWETSPEMQLIDDPNNPDSKLSPKRSAGALYDLIAPVNKTIHPAGDWNTGRLVFHGRTVEHWLNEKKVVEYRYGGPEIKALIAASKFSNVPLFMKANNGHIAFQHHGAEIVSFRNIRIRRARAATFSAR